MNNWHARTSTSDGAPFLTVGFAWGEDTWEVCSRSSLVAQCISRCDGLDTVHSRKGIATVPPPPDILACGCGELSW
jgi:hypothetical protein